ncbi:nitroreductase family protein [Macrococcoides caseolyticum]|uniref:nitroreductase family protein n=1 Tax=Macrococcoides caseolyticum TaxID=69966 RepID=UPI001F1F1C85|nr:nitroreductase family protein [Macrococcus caseolyticus]MCE4955814.1 nitroreductase family protein [Macrococcus caseolyticus]
MELKDAIINRRSIKQYEDSSVDDAAVERAISLSTYAPNHGMREPWRVVWIKKDRIEDYANVFGNIAFKNNDEKIKMNTNKMMGLAGILIIIGPRDRRQKENLEDILAIGGFMQTLSLALFEEGIGSCIKTQPPLLHPELSLHLGCNADEMIYGAINLTAQTEADYKARKNQNLINIY